MNHCIAKIIELVDQGRDDRRSVLQLGYNLGRLSELTGLGREPFWDRWKEAVDAWDLLTLRRLASELTKLPALLADPNDQPPDTQPSQALGRIES